ncbi:MAG TPA: hypothetical protein VM870_08840 [Pyrinomonadaceae bacterium]|jgi:hypothetical protein|nr:hypothetical protein [Pyrinomonadaceae bacterium]
MRKSGAVINFPAISRVTEMEDLLAAYNFDTPKTPGGATDWQLFVANAARRRLCRIRRTILIYIVRRR